MDSLFLLLAGCVGLAIGAELLVRGASRLALTLGVAPIVVELDQAKWDIAREAGAGEVIDPSADGALRALIKSTGGGVAAAIDFVGAAATFNFGFGALP